MMNSLALATFGAITLFETGVVAQADCPDGGVLFELELLTDDNPGDTSYEIHHALSLSEILDQTLEETRTTTVGDPPGPYTFDDDYFVDDDDDSVPIAERSDFDAPGTLYTRSHCLESGRRYTFIIYDDSGDGLCCNAGSGFYIISVDGEIKGSGDMFGYKEWRSFYATGPPSPTTPAPAPVPAPCNLVDDSCSSNSDCCSNKCRGKKRGPKTCNRG
jgi:hypothetical protein